jgi:hypothetical protein
MKKEMASYPWIAAGVTSLGIVTALALILLVVLEIQWIRLFRLRIKQLQADLQERQPMRGSDL